jgi:hypothetical protein
MKEPVYYPPRVKQARLQAVVDLLEAGHGPAMIEFVGDPPELSSSATLPRPCARVEGGKLIFLGTPIITGPAQVPGTFTKARLFDGNGEVVMVMSVGPKDSSASIRLPSKALNPRFGIGVMLPELCLYGG